MKCYAATIVLVLLAAPTRAVELADIWAAEAAVERAQEAPAPRAPVAAVSEGRTAQRLFHAPAPRVVFPGPTSPRWSINGTYAPSRAATITHLLTAAEHRGKYTRVQLDAMSTDDLRRLHSADHNASRLSGGRWAYKTVCRGGRCVRTRVWIAN